MPGLTGLAQANGRNALTWDEKFKYDLRYVRKITLINDFRIILDTIVSVFKREGIGENGKSLSLDYGDYLLKNKRITRQTYIEKQKEAALILEGEKQNAKI